MQKVYSEYQEEGYRSQQIAQDKGIEIYPGLTPVNTFRLVFNEFFGGEYVFLEDVS